MPSVGKLYVDINAITASAEKSIQKLQNLANKPINLNINTGNYARPLGQITSKVSEFNKSLEASNARVIAFGASAGLVYGVEKAFQSLIKTTIEVEKKLNDIRVIVNANREDFTKFSNSLFDVATKTGQTFNTAADAALELARQGLGLEATLKRTQAALTLTRISGIEVAKSVDTITAAINSFNKAAIDDITLVSKLSNVDTKFAVSAGDLADALSRVGSTAQDAGVSIDELIGITTAVQQITSRGGAVIGNALKTIFTRINDTKTISQLKALGVQIDESQSGIEKLRTLADAIKSTDVATGNTIKKLVGGVYQINVVSAALSDLSNQYSITSNAIQTAANSTDEAEKRLTELNKSISALINETLNNLSKFGSNIGEAIISPNIKNILVNLNEVLNVFNSEGVLGKGEAAGESLGQVFLKSFGQFIGGPGLLLATTLLGKLLFRLGSFAGESILTIFKSNKELKLQSELAREVSLILQGQQGIIQGLANRTLTVADAERQVLQQLISQNREREIQLGLTNRIASTLKGTGFRLNQIPIGDDRFSVLQNQNKKYNGLIPNFKDSDKIMEKAGAYAGGYTPGNVKEMNLPKMGKIFYNSAEKIKKFAGMDQPAIIPPRNSKAGKQYSKDFEEKLGFNPYKAKGLIPNFIPPVGIQLGKGAFGAFFDLQRKFKKINIGKKVFHDENSFGLYKEEAIHDEFEATKYINELKDKPPLFKIPKLIGNKKRAQQRGYIGKEVVQGLTVNDYLNILEEKYDDELSLPAKFVKKAKYNINEYLHYDTDIGSSDFHNKNVMINDILAEKLEKIYENNPDRLKKIIGDDRLFKQVSKALEKQGGGLYGIDFGLTEKKFNKGLIPNFATFRGVDKAFKSLQISNKYGKSTIADLDRDIPTLDHIETFIQGKGHSKLIYKEVFQRLKEKGYKGVGGFLLNQGKTPRSGAPIDKLLAQFPQLTRGKLGSRNRIDLDEDLGFDIAGGDKFDQDLAKKASFILREMQNRGVGDIDFTSYFSKGLVPNFNMFSSAMMLGRGIKGISSVVNPKKLMGLATGRVDPESLVPELIEFLKQPSEIFKSIDDLNAGSSLLNFVLRNDTVREKFALLGANKIPERTFNINDVIQDFGQDDYTIGINNYAKYRLFGGIKKEPNDILQSHFKDSILKNRDGSYRFNSNNFEGSTELIQIMNSLNKYIDHPNINRYNPKTRRILGNTFTLGNFIGTHNRSKTKAVYEDRWDVDLNPIELEALQKLIGSKKEDLVDRFGQPKFNYIVEEKINKDYASGKHSQTYGQNLDSLMLRYLVSKLPADPLTYKGVVNLTKKKTDDDILINKGLIPNFSFPALKESLKREAAAGVPISSIRFDTNPKLISKQNPIGFGVYNTIDEPKGLNQGITNITKLGMNPKTYIGGASEGFIPNYASRQKDPFLPYAPKAPKIGFFDPNEPPNSLKRVTTTTQQVQPNLVNLTGQNVKTITSTKGLETAQIEEINKVIEEAVTNIKKFGANWKINPKFQKLQQKIDDIVNNANGGATALRVTKTALTNAAKQAFEYQNALKKFNKDSQKYEIQINQLLKQRSSLFPGASIKKLDNAALTDPRLAALIQQADDSRSNKRFGFSAAASFALPLVLNAATSSIDRETESGRKTGAAVDFAGNIGSTALLGASFGPVGAAVGGAFGALSGFSNFYKEFTTKLPELENALEKSSQKIESLQNSVGQYISSLEKYQNALTDVNSSIKISDIQKFRKQTIDKLLEVPAEFRSRIASASGSISELSNVLGELSEKLGKEQKLKESLLSLNKIFETTTGIFDKTVFDKKQKDNKTNEEKTAKILTQFIDPKELQNSGLFEKLIELTRLVQSGSTLSLNNLLSTLKEAGKVPEEIIEQFSKFQTNSDVINFGKIVETTVRQINQSNEFTKVIEENSKRMVRINSNFKIITRSLEKDLNNLIIGLGQSAESASQNVATKNQTLILRRNTGIEGNIERFRGESKLQEPFLSDIGNLKINQSLEQITTKFENLQKVQELTSNIQEKAVKIFSDKILNATQDVVRITKDISEGGTETNESRFNQQVAEKDIKGLTAAFDEILKSLSENPLQAIPSIPNEVFKGVSESETNSVKNALNVLANEFKNGLILLNENEKKTLSLQSISNAYQKTIAEQQKNLNRFGGIQSFINKEGKNNSIELLRESLNLRSNNNQNNIDQGIFSAKLIENLINNVGLSGEQLPKGLINNAIQGRTESIIEQLDLSALSAKNSGQFNSENIKSIEAIKKLAPEIAALQVKSLAKFDTLPEGITQLQKLNVLLNQQINNFSEKYIDNNRKAFTDAINQTGLDSNTSDIRNYAKSILDIQTQIVKLTTAKDIAEKESVLEATNKNISNNKDQIGSIVKNILLNAREQLLPDLNNPDIPTEGKDQIIQAINRVNELTKQFQKTGNVTEEELKSIEPFIKNYNNFIDTLNKGIDSNSQFAPIKFSTENLNLQGLNSLILEQQVLIKQTEELQKRINEIKSVAKGDESLNGVVRFLKEKDATKSIVPTTSVQTQPIQNTVSQELLKIQESITQSETENLSLKSKQQEIILKYNQELEKGNNSLEKHEDLYNEVNTIQKLVNEESKKYRDSLNNANTSLKIIKSSGVAFSDEISNATREVNELKARFGELETKDLGTQFLDTLRYGFNDFQRDLNNGVIDIGLTLRESFKDGFKEFIKGTKSAEDAFRDFALSVANKALDISTDIAFNQLFGSISSGAGSLFGNSSAVKKSKGGKIKGYATGGVVTGGTGVKDDVPAFLTAGEFVINKKAVNVLGTDILDQLNEQKISRSEIKNYPSGADISLTNDILLSGPTNRPTDARNIFDSRLSNFALTNEEDLATARRIKTEEDLVNYLYDLQAYEKQKRDAMKQYKKGKKQAFYGALIQAGFSAGAGYISSNVGLGNQINKGMLPAKSFNTSPNLAYVNKGGPIKKYATGGYNEDTIPALLTGGEFIVNKEAVRKYGSDFFEKLNMADKPARFATGGLVGSNSRVGIDYSDSDKGLDSVIEKLEKIAVALNTKEYSPSNTLEGNNNLPNNTTNVSININVSENGKVSSTVSNNSTNSKDQQSSKEKEAQYKELAVLMEGLVYKVLNKEQRPGGQLSSIK